MAADSATDVNKTRAQARDKSEARLAILEAARRVLARDGADNTTLAEVANEAGFARPTVYGYFRNKDELLQAVSADDLARVAQTMAGNGPEQSEVPEASAEGLTANAGFNDTDAGPSRGAQIIAMPSSAMIEPPHAMAEALEPVPQAEAAAHDFFRELANAAPPVEPAKPARAPVSPSQKSALDDILSKLTPNDPENGEGSAAALARFDRRLRVVERTLTEVQTVQERSEKTSTNSADSISENLRSLNQRLEESERRQRETFAELRAGAREAARRLESLEGQKLQPAITVAAPAAPTVTAPATPSAPAEAPSVPVDLREAVYQAPAATEAPLLLTEPVIEPAASEIEKDVKTPVFEPGPEKTNYLAAARRSAAASQAQAAAVAETPEKKPRSWLYRVPRKYLMLTCGLMTVVTFSIGVLVVQRMSAIAAHAETMSEAKAHVALAAVVPIPQAQPKPHRLAMATPLDELSALATGGNAKAQLIVGYKYLKGADGVPKNEMLAAQWLARAAQRGEPMAQYWTGYVYQHGLGVSRDPSEALRWYEAAADQGNTKAMYNLGVGYAEGWTGPKDSPEAARWFARAARLGFVDAQFNLAVLCERGEGVPPSLLDAYKWYAIAASNGDADSKRRIDAIATQLSPDDLAAAQRSAMSFRPTPTVRDANIMPVLDLKRG